MGLFSSEKVTSVGTSVMRLIVDKSVPNCILMGQAKALVAGDDQMMEHMVEEIANNIGMRAERMYSYAQNNYVHGLPTSTVMSNADGAKEAAKAIQLEVGSPVVVTYFRCGPVNKIHYGWKTLIESHGYSEDSNQLGALTTQKGTPVFLDDMVVVLRQADVAEYTATSFDQWGKSPNSGASPTRPLNSDPALAVEVTPSPMKVDPTSVNDYLLVSYSWLSPTKQVLTGTFQIPFPVFNSGKDYYQVKYSFGAKVGYWIYEDDSGVHPALDAVLQTTHTVSGSYFPFTYFRFDKTSEDDRKDTPAYKSSKRMMKYLGLDYEDLVSSVNSNPDIKDVEQALMMFAVPAHSTNEDECRYLYDYFDALHDADVAQYPTEVKGSVFSHKVDDRLSGASKGRTIVIQDKKLSMALSYTLIHKAYKNGTIGKVGAYTATRVVATTEHSAAVTTGGVASWTSSSEHYAYKMQVSEGLYSEIQVHGLRMVYQIYGGYSSIGEGNSPTLLIPIDKSISYRYNSIVREVLYSRSIHMIFNSRVVTSLPWYASTWFKIILIVVMIVITVLTYGATVQGLAAAFAAGTITAGALAYAVMLMIIEAVVISYAVKKFVKAVGGEAALIIAIVAAAAGYGSMATSDSLMSSTWSETLVQVSSNLVKGVNSSIQDSLVGLQSEISEFNMIAGEKVKELEVANTLLDSNPIYAPLIVWGETPKDFYNRTVHSGNVGVLGIDAISSYYDAALTLPSISETMRDL